MYFVDWGGGGGVPFLTTTKQTKWGGRNERRGKSANKQGKDRKRQKEDGALVVVNGEGCGGK
jgi:hypothetical protein